LPQQVRQSGSSAMYGRTAHRSPSLSNA
jgi:hypothetical protein